jgi:hypothetical protein
VAKLVRPVAHQHNSFLNELRAHGAEHRIVKLLVTGGGGFISSNILRSILDDV